MEKEAVNFCVNCRYCVKDYTYKCSKYRDFHPVTGQEILSFCVIKNRKGDCEDYDLFIETKLPVIKETKLPVLQEEHASSYDIVPTTYKEPWWLPILKKIYEWIAR